MTFLTLTAEFAWFAGKTCVCFAARVSGFTATKGPLHLAKKIRETYFDPIEGKSIHICLFALCKAVPVSERRFDP